LSGGDEKVLRSFDPAFSFIKAYNSVTKGELRFRNEATNEQVEQKLKGTGDAAKQPLGLMNKPVNIDFGQDLQYDPTTFLSNKEEEVQI